MHFWCKGPEEAAMRLFAAKLQHASVLESLSREGSRLDHCPGQDVALRLTLPCLLNQDRFLLLWACCCIYLSLLAAHIVRGSGGATAVVVCFLQCPSS